MADFTLAEGDLLPEINATLKDANDTAIDLTGSTVEFLMSTSSDLDTLIVDGVATIVDEDAGEVKYTWVSGDTDTPGNYVARFRVTTSTSKKYTFPNIGWITVTITPNYA